MDLQLTGQIVVVIGAARGIGAAIATAFAEEKARVVLVDRDAAVHATAKELASRFPDSILGRELDATDFAATERLLDDVETTWGVCQHAVFAAGMGSGKFGFPFWNLSPDDWPRVLQVNLLGAVNLAHALAPRMAAAREGTLLFLSSVAAQIGSQTDPPYSAAKAALVNFAQCAAKDLAPYGVRVNSLAPGMVKTALNQSVWQSWNDRQSAADQLSYEEWAGQKVARTVPLARWQTPQDMAAMAVFLASPLAKNITGQTLNVDGGQVMR